MSVRSFAMLTVAAALTALPGCDSCVPSSPSKDDTGKGTTTQGPTAVDWDALYAGLMVTPETEPPVSSGGTGGVSGSQLMTGSTAVMLPNLPDPSAGMVHTQSPTPPSADWTEAWVVYNLPAVEAASQMMQLTYVGPQNAILDETVLAGYRADEISSGKDYKLGSLVFRYWAFPPDASINAIPDQAPPDVTAHHTFRVETLKGGTTTETGRLYREVATQPSGGVIWRDSWVLYNTYEKPGPIATTQLTPLAATDPNDHDNLRQFLDFTRAASASKVGWRFVPITYGWGELPPAP